MQTFDVTLKTTVEADTLEQAQALATDQLSIVDHDATIYDTTDIIVRAITTDHQHGLLDAYNTRMTDAITKAGTDRVALENLVNRIYEDGFQDGVNDITEGTCANCDGPLSHSCPDTL